MTNAVPQFSHQSVTWYCAHKLSADALRMALFPASHVVVVGGGLAGMVVANQVPAHMCLLRFVA